MNKFVDFKTLRVSSYIASALATKFRMIKSFSALAVQTITNLEQNCQHQTMPLASLSLFAPGF